MSYVFLNADDQATVWSPALQVGALFVAVCDVVSRSLTTPHGLEAEASDYITIRGKEFSSFVTTWTEAYIASHNIVLQMEWRPFLVLAIALLQKMDTSVLVASDAARALVADAGELLRHMPV